MTKKLVVFDMDDTLIKGNTWADFNAAMGVTQEQDWGLYSAFSEQKITYQEWLGELHKLYNFQENKHTKEQVLTYLTQYELAPYAAKVVQAIKAAGHETLLLTGSFQMTADAVAFETGISNSIAVTNCIFDDNGDLLRLESAGDEQYAKHKLLLSFCRERNIEAGNCIVLGDGANDMILFEKYTDTVTFTHAASNIQKLATHVIESLSDLPKLVNTITE